MSVAQARAETSAMFHRFAPMDGEGEGACSGELGNTGGAVMVAGDWR